jgi:hypothetical protein
MPMQECEEVWRAVAINLNKLTMAVDDEEEPKKIAAKSLMVIEKLASFNKCYRREMEG